MQETVHNTNTVWTLSLTINVLYIQCTYRSAHLSTMCSSDEHGFDRPVVRCPASGKVLLSTLDTV